MISRVSAGSSSSSRDLIGLTFAESSGASSISATTNPVDTFVPNGTSTRDPSRTASRNDSGIAYVNVPWTATGRAISAYDEIPCATLPSVDHCGGDDRARHRHVHEHFGDRHSQPRLA